jgi:hypothetical protein
MSGTQRAFVIPVVSAANAATGLRNVIIAGHVVGIALMLVDFMLLANYLGYDAFGASLSPLVI